MNPADDYDPIADVWASEAEARRIIRERMAKGGEPWQPNRFTPHPTGPRHCVAGIPATDTTLENQPCTPRGIE